MVMGVGELMLITEIREKFPVNKSIDLQLPHSLEHTLVWFVNFHKFYYQKIASYNYFIGIKHNFEIHANQFTPKLILISLKLFLLFPITRFLLLCYLSHFRGFILVILGGRLLSLALNGIQSISHEHLSSTLSLFRGASFLPILKELEFFLRLRYLRFMSERLMKICHQLNQLQTCPTPIIPLLRATLQFPTITLHLHHLINLINLINLTHLILHLPLIHPLLIHPLLPLLHLHLHLLLLLIIVQVLGEVSAGANEAPEVPLMVQQIYGSGNCYYFKHDGHWNDYLQSGRVFNFCFCSTQRLQTYFQIFFLILLTNFLFIFGSLFLSFQPSSRSCSLLLSPGTSVCSISQHSKTHSLIHPYPTPLFIRLSSALASTVRKPSYPSSVPLDQPCSHWGWVFSRKPHIETVPYCYYCQVQQIQSIPQGIAPLGLTSRNQIYK